MSNRYSCVLFDLDGTVIDTVHDCATAVNLTMSDFGFPTHTDEEVRSYLNNGARRLIARALPEVYAEDEELIDRVLSCYIDHYTDHCTDTSTVYDGVLPLLSSLHDEGVSLGLVTNKPDVQTQIMAPYYFGDLFSYREGNRPGVPPKPDRCRVLSALAALGKRPEETLFVGDSHVDVKTAENGGVDCCVVSWGFAGEKTLRERGGYTYLIRRAEELLPIVHGEVSGCRY